MSRLHWSSALAILALAPGLAQAQDIEEEDLKVVRGDEKDSSKRRPAKKIAYLGVSTEPVRAIVSTQLGLPKGQGLTVINVADGSPAKGALQNHDILLRFGDQILINREQLGVLVRSQKPGAAVELEVLRRTKKRAVKVVLGERDESSFKLDLHLDKDLNDLRLKMPELDFTKKGFPFGDEGFKKWMDGLEGDTRKEIERWFGKGPGAWIPRLPGQNDKSVYQREDDEHKLELTIEDGKTRIIVRDKDGKILVEEELVGEGQLKELDPALRSKIEKLHKRARSKRIPRNRFIFPDNEEEETRDFLGRRLPRFLGRAVPPKAGKELDEVFKELEKLLDSQKTEKDELAEVFKELEKLLQDRKLEKLEERLQKMGKRLEREGKERGEKIRRSVERRIKRARRNPWTEEGDFDSVIQQSDDAHSVTVTVKDGKRRVEVRDAKGGLVYEGPYDTEDQRQAVPESVRGKVEKLMKRVIIEKKERRHHR